MVLLNDERKGFNQLSVSFKLYYKESPNQGGLYPVFYEKVQLIDQSLFLADIFIFPSL